MTACKATYDRTEYAASAAAYTVPREALDAVIDTNAFHRELEAERTEAVFLEGVRQRVRRALSQNLAGDDG
jgi:hypothetical protein